MAGKIPHHDLSVCMACRSCVQVCPVSCLTASVTGMDRYNKAYPALSDPAKCTSCGMCERICPVGAITMVARA